MPGDKMSNPQRKEGHLRVDHSIGEQIMVSDFTKRQRKILDLILRLSWGCNKEEAIIPKQNCFEIVGLYEGDIKKELAYLELANVITIDGDRYSFNKDFDRWRVSLAKNYNPAKLSELLRINLNGLSKTLSNNLVKHEELTSQNTKSFTPELASPKEKERNIKESIYIDNNNGNKKEEIGTLNKYTSGIYGQYVQH